MEEKYLKSDLMAAIHRLSKVKSSIDFDDVCLTKAEFYCMGMIEEHCRSNPEGRGMYVWEIAEKAKVRPPAVSRMLRGLEERNFIERKIDSNDRRNIFVTLTDEGRTTWESAAEKFGSFTQKIASEMGREDLEDLIRLINRLSDVIEEEMKEG